MRKFNSFEEYENYAEAHSIDQALIDDGRKIAMDMFTNCKSFRTAINRFAKAFAEVEDIDSWAEGMIESCENGYFSDSVVTTKRSDFCGTDEEWREYINEQTNGGKDFFAYGIEETDEGRWYIFLNTSGIYAGRE